MMRQLFIAVFLCLLYSSFLAYGPKPAKVKTQSQWQNNQYVAESYMRIPIADDVNSKLDVVIVGSSLAQRLDFADSSKCVFNLAFGGDSALTGLSIIAAAPTSPRIVYVEINVPIGSVNHELINRASHFGTHLPPMFYVENMPINLLISFLYQFKTSKMPLEPIESARKNSLALQVKNYQSLIPPQDLENNMGEFAQLVNGIEAKGIKVVFFEMPVYPDLEYLPRPTQIRHAFKSKFPKHQLIQFNELVHGDKIKTADGIHLLSDEAIIATKNMASFFERPCFKSI